MAETESFSHPWQQRNLQKWLHGFVNSCVGKKQSWRGLGMVFSQPNDTFWHRNCLQHDHNFLWWLRKQWTAWGFEETWWYGTCIWGLPVSFAIRAVGVCDGSADRNDLSEQMIEVAVLSLVIIWFPPIVVSTGMNWPNYAKYEPFNNWLVTKKNNSFIQVILAFWDSTKSLKAKCFCLYI